LPKLDKIIGEIEAGLTEVYCTKIFFRGFFLLRQFSHLLAETLWPLRHFGRFSHRYIKPCCNSINYFIYLEIMTELT